MKAPQEFKVVSLRECPTPESLLICETPEQVAEYWRLNIASNPYYNSDCECLAVLLLNTRRRVKGHQLLSFGTIDTLLVDVRTVFRGAIIASASSVTKLLET